MFERFTDTARYVIVQAQHDARRLGHNYIGCEQVSGSRTCVPTRPTASVGV